APPRMKPHLTSVIRRSAGRDARFARSTAVSSAWPKRAKGLEDSNPAAASAPRVRKMRLDRLCFMGVPRFLFLLAFERLPGTRLQQLLDALTRHRQLADVRFEPPREIAFDLVGPARVDLAGRVNAGS